MVPRHTVAAYNLHASTNNNLLHSTAHSPQPTAHSPQPTAHSPQLLTFNLFIFLKPSAGVRVQQNPLECGGPSVFIFRSALSFP